ncbi:hypothetical protein Vadar_016212 [Vaccinium darrowii]|uniref:Uncharacterized protein n=1 Tax=Vaccinium darrowii TaxID=229202 RepID=A0ACB7ZKL5_9ERIC|nr:hypothetical protein Vadar_016212 [Vaccinium darrowii]
MHTLYVDYLPEDVGTLWFWKIFSNFGNVKDSFIPMKRSKISGCNFGFIRYDFEEEARRAIDKANGLWIDDRGVVVKIVNYDKKKDNQKAFQKKGKNEDPNVNSLKSSQGLESFVEDSLGLHSLFYEAHDVELVKKTRSQEKLLDVYLDDLVSIDKAASGGSDYDDTNLVSNEPLIKYVDLMRHKK